MHNAGNRLVVLDMLPEEPAVERADHTHSVLHSFAYVIPDSILEPERIFASAGPLYTVACFSYNAQVMGKKPQGLWFHILDILFNIVVIVAIVGGIRTFLVSPFQVEGSSMFSTLEDKEYIIINKLAYYLGMPERGDIVVFRPPVDHQKYYVKRVIGMGGDEVVIEGGDVFVKPKGSNELTKLDEPYLDEKNAHRTFKHPPWSGDTSKETYVVPDGRYFLLGDNRQGSQDSRSFFSADNVAEPFVTREDIKGRVWFVALPISKVHAFEPPEYGL
jgi:signal peptidase I